MSSTPNVRVGVGCLVTHPLHPQRVLLGRRKGSHGAGRFALPGGHLEMGESWSDCASREVKEETNLTLRDVLYVHCTNDIAIDGNPLKHYVTIFMRGEVSDDSEQLVNMEPNKCEEWIWMPWDELCNMPREQLFDPLIHLIEERGPSLFA